MQEPARYPQGPDMGSLTMGSGGGAPTPAVIPQLFQAAEVLAKRVEGLRQRLDPIVAPGPPQALGQGTGEHGTALQTLLTKLRQIEQELASLTENVVL